MWEGVPREVPWDLSPRAYPGEAEARHEFLSPETPVLSQHRTPRGLTGSAASRLGMVGVCWSTHTTFFMSSKLGSLGTTS